MPTVNATGSLTATYFPQQTATKLNGPPVANWSGHPHIRYATNLEIFKVDGSYYTHEFKNGDRTQTGTWKKLDSAPFFSTQLEGLKVATTIPTDRGPKTVVTDSFGAALVVGTAASLGERFRRFFGID